MGRDFQGGPVSLTRTDMLGILYLNGEEFEVLSYMSIFSTGEVGVQTMCARACRHKRGKGQSVDFLCLDTPQPHSSSMPTSLVMQSMCHTEAENQL